MGNSTRKRPRPSGNQSEKMWWAANDEPFSGANWCAANDEPFRTSSAPANEDCNSTTYPIPKDSELELSFYERLGVSYVFLPTI
jgi:hypothetical protein